MPLRFALPIVFTFVCVIGFYTESSHAARFTGSYLLHVCASDPDGREVVPGGHSACQSYIAGVIDYHNLIRSLGTAPSVDFCVPESATLYQIQRQVVSYIFRNREQQGPFLAAPGVALALHSAYPCRR